MSRATQIKAWGEVGKELGALAAGNESSRYWHEYEKAARQSEHVNGWFTRKSVDTALSGIAKMLDTGKMEKWLSAYPEKTGNPLKVGIIMAGNIPLAGFHDFLCVLLSGNIAVVKQSSSDKYLLPFVAGILFDLMPQIRERMIMAEQLKNIDAIIATGSNNTARYFEYYFSKIPHIFRKNRNSVAVITGEENEFDLLLLGRDLFTYFGLGCRNVSKLFVPEGYQFDELFKNLVSYGDLLQHSKYINNHDYHQALFLLNSDVFLTNNFLIIRENESLSSPVGVLHYETYTSEEELENKLALVKDQLQCVVRKNSKISFGQAQFPEVDDYADGIDTMKFLTELR